MRPLLVSLVSTVQLTRLANAFAGVASLWFVVLWTRAEELEHGHGDMGRMQLWVPLGLAGVLGVGMSLYAGALNDLFDVRKDQALAPRRPIAAGRITLRAAMIIGFASLLASLLAATVLGRPAVLMCLLCASSVLFFNTTARHIPSLGLLTVAVIYGSHMLTMNLGFRFIWPILLIMIHTLVVHAAVHRLERKRPKFTSLTWVGTALGLVGLSVLLWAQAGHEGVLWSPAYVWYQLSWPIAAALLFLLTSINKVRFASSSAFAAEKLQRYGALWMGIYGVAWLLGGGLHLEAAILGALVTMGILWMLLVRDLGAWMEQPVGYRW